MTDSIKIRLQARFSEPIKEFAKRHIIFWHDAEGAFTDEVPSLVLPNVNIITLTGRNNFAVKKLLTVDDLTGNYLIYNPISYSEDKKGDNWLRDIELYADEPFFADQISERLSFLGIDPSNDAMRKAISLYDKFFKNADRMARLQRLGTNYHAASELHTNIMLVLCGRSGGAADVIKAVLSGGLDVSKNSVVENITRFGDINALTKLLNTYTGYTYDEAKPLSELAARVLFTGLSQNLNTKAFAGIEKYVSDTHKSFCYQFIHEWQNASDSDVLFDICRQIESMFNLGDRLKKVDIDELLKCDTLPIINELILEYYINAVCERVIKPEQLMKMVETRRILGWYEQTADYFDCLYYAAKINEYKLFRYDGFHTVEAKNIWKEYMTSDYAMDSYYRSFHLAFGRAIGSNSNRLEDGLKKLADTIENVYHNWYLKELNVSWVKAIGDDLRENGYITSLGISRQTDFYSKYVRATVTHGSRAVVIISDALRFEVAAELKERLCRDTKGKATVEGMQSIFPGITKFGMAALLPTNHLSISEKQEVLVNGKPTQSTAMRDAVLKATNKNSVATTYETLLRMKKDERRELVKGMDVVYIYHNSIDTEGENNETKVFEACETAMSEIATLCNIIVGDLSSTNIFITADHGFLYTYNPLIESDKIAKQVFVGETYEIGRRYALVAPETSAEYMLPVRLDKVYSGANILGYAPRDTVRIKLSGGGANYVHGGVTLQEMCVPVIVYKGARADYKSAVEARNPRFTIVSESRKLTNKIFTLDFLQREAVSDKIKKCEYKLFFADAAGNPVSDTRTVIADKADINDSMRVYRVKFALKSIKFDNSATYRLIITNEIDIPEEIEFKIDLAFSDDFGF